MSLLDWPGLMQAGLHGLRLRPDQFWRLTPAELRMMLGANAVPAPFTRARLDALLTAFPDGKKEEDNGHN